jgi:hypothetical protein
MDAEFLECPEVFGILAEQMADYFRHLLEELELLATEVALQDTRILGN